MKITIETIPHDKQRYATAGDWIFGADGLHIYVSDLGDPDMEALVGLHEMVEALLCEKRGIAEPDVRAFDEAHPDDPDPGDHPLAPYRTEHKIAEDLEMQFAIELGVDIEAYGKRVEALFG